MDVCRQAESRGLPAFELDFREADQTLFWPRVLAPGYASVELYDGGARAQTRVGHVHADRVTLSFDIAQSKIRIAEPIAEWSMGGDLLRIEVPLTMKKLVAS